MCVCVCVYVETNKRCYRHKYHLTSIINLSSWLLLGLRMPSVNAHSLDPWGVICEEGSDDQVNEKILRNTNLLIMGLMKVYL